jgi:CheY-like chemotaxis protein
MMNINVQSSRQLLFCDAEPDSRCRLAEKLNGFGFTVLATGNPQIASGLLQERSFAALLVSMDKMRLAMVPVIVDARRCRPDLPIVVILSESGRETIPPGLADLVLVNPSDRKLRDSLRVFADRREPMPVAC